MDLSNGKIWGKVVGSVLGFAIGGPPGSIFGFIIGHAYDGRNELNDKDIRERRGAEEDRQNTFSVSIIALGAKLAKADGRVMRAEVDAFKRVFNVSPAQESVISDMYNHARRTASGYQPYAINLARAFRDNPIVLQNVLGGLFVIAAADGALTEPEMKFLKTVGIIFDIDADNFHRIAARAGVRLPESQKPPRPADDNYTIPGIRPDATNEDVKSAYRALIREHHPDKLIAQGMPPEFIATATEKMKRFNVAYDIICKERGI